MIELRIPLKLRARRPGPSDPSAPSFTLSSAGGAGAAGPRWAGLAQPLSQQSSCFMDHACTTAPSGALGGERGRGDAIIATQEQASTG